MTAAAARDDPGSPLPRARTLLGVSAVLLLLFSSLVGLRLHGYSLGYWHEIIDQSPADEILLGQARWIRGDDWHAILPMALAQRAHDPPFPVTNTRVGLGQNMLLPFPMPVAHPLTLFRPTTWGFFVGDDVGLAWLWWSRLLVLLGAFCGVLLVLTGGSTAISALGGLALALSPFFLFWSVRPAPVAAYGALAFLAGLAVLFARRTGVILASGGALGWSLAAFALVLYPAFQLPIAALLSGVFVAVTWQHRAALDPGRQLPWRLLALGLAAAVVVGAGLLLLRSAGADIEVIRQTRYPGQRVSTGGGRAVWDFFAANLGMLHQVGALGRWGPMQNVCVAAGFFVLSPVVLAASVWRAAPGAKGHAASGAKGIRAAARQLDPVVVVLATALVGLVVHATVEIPRELALATGLAWVPGVRSMIAFGIAETLLLARLLARRNRVPLSGLRALALAAAWGGLLALAATGLAARVPAYDAGPGYLFAAGNVLVAWLALTARRAWLPVALVAGASAVGSLWFNPAVRGGADYLQENALSREILEIDEAMEGESVWAVYGSAYAANLFRVLGVRALNGIHPVPQLEFWEVLDPGGLGRDVYNTYANLSFRVVDEPAVQLGFKRGTGLVARLHPRNRALTRLGVTHALVHELDAELYAELSGQPLVASVGPFRIFAVE